MKVTREKFRKAIAHACRKNGVRFRADEMNFTMNNKDPERAVAVHFRVFEKNLLGATPKPGSDGFLDKDDFVHVDVDIRLVADEIAKTLKPRQIVRDKNGAITGVKNAKALRIIAYKAVNAAIKPRRRDAVPT